MLNFTPLLGAQTTSLASQSLLELDGGVNILIDVGWDDDFSPSLLTALQKQIPTLSAVLLTHATYNQLGAFAHVCKHFPRFTRIPIYATEPVISLGRTLLQDLYASTPLAASTIPKQNLSDENESLASVEDQARSDKILLPAPTADEIASYFSIIHPLKYSQPHQPVPQALGLAAAGNAAEGLGNLTITAYSAGHTLGGTLWHLQQGMESIVYAYDWNLARDNICPSAAFLAPGSSEVIEPLRRPSALVCSARGAERMALSGGRKRRDDELVRLVRKTIEQSGCVLIPSDSAARVLEIAYLLEQAWRKDEFLRRAKLYFASKSAGSTIRYAKSLLEWMDEGVMKENENSPWDFNFLKVIERKSQVRRALNLQQPRVILASDGRLGWGYAREAIEALAGDPRNLVILPERVERPLSAGGTLGTLLWKLWDDQKGTAETENITPITCNGAEADLQSFEIVRLQGDELNVYQQHLSRQRQLQQTMQAVDGSAALETSADAVEERSETTSTTSDESEGEMQGKALNVSAVLTQSRHRLGLSDAELGINVLLRRKNVHDYDVRDKKGREKMFPYVAKRKRADEFGDIIRPEEYLRAEEREEADGDDIRNGNAQQAQLGQKRKWDDAAMANSSGRKGPAKRRKSDGGGDAPTASAAQDASDESEESDYEPNEDLIQGPSKACIAFRKLQLNCQLAHVDFSGLHDKRSLQLLIPLINPRKLVLVGGNESETLSLANDCRAALRDDAGKVVIMTPLNGETVEASVDTNAWVVKLSRSLVKQLQWQQVRGLGVVAITAQLGAEETPAATDEDLRQRKLMKSEGGEAQQTAIAPTTSTPLLDVVPASRATATRSVVAQPLHVGDLRLTDLRKLMQAGGHTAEFRGEGTLLIDGLVAVRKSGTGKIEVEGSAALLDANARSHPGGGAAALCFYQVKKKIYEGLAVVANG